MFDFSPMIDISDTHYWVMHDNNTPTISERFSLNCINLHFQCWSQSGF